MFKKSAKNTDFNLLKSKVKNKSKPFWIIWMKFKPTREMNTEFL